VGRLRLVELSRRHPALLDARLHHRVSKAEQLAYALQVDVQVSLWAGGTREHGLRWIDRY
jgi:hypothetical protein